MYAELYREISNVYPFVEIISSVMDVCFNFLTDVFEWLWVQFSVFVAFKGPDGPSQNRVDLKGCPDCTSEGPAGPQTGEIHTAT